MGRRTAGTRFQFQCFVGCIGSQKTDQRLNIGIFLNELPKGHFDTKGAFDALAELNEEQRIESEFEKGGLGVEFIQVHSGGIAQNLRQLCFGGGSSS